MLNDHFNIYILNQIMIVFCSTLISNGLGAGKPEAAKVALCAVLVLGVAEFLIACVAIFICRDLVGYAFSGEKEVIDGVKEMVPFLCCSIIVDSLQSLLSGDFSRLCF